MKILTAQMPGQRRRLAKGWNKLVRLDFMSASGEFFDILTTKLINTYQYIYAVPSLQSAL